MSQTCVEQRISPDEARKATTALPVLPERILTTFAPPLATVDGPLSLVSTTLYAGGPSEGEKKGVPERQFPKKTACSSYAQPWLVVIGGWRLVVFGSWRLATGGWWRLVVVGGGWRLVVGG